MHFPNVILDATNFACQSIMSKKKHFNIMGQDISAAMNFLEKLDQIEVRFTPKKVICCWEGGKCLKRLAVYADYKANRPAHAGEGSESFEVVFGPIAEQLEYENFSIPGLEGDDSIAFRARDFYESGEPCLVVSPDKDMLQLVTSDDMIQCFLPHKNLIVNSSNIQEHTGVPLGAFQDYLVLVGDVGDNVPGVAGVAGVTAKWILNEFGSIDNALASESDIKLMASGKGKAGASARRALSIFSDESKQVIERNRKLVVL